MGIYTGDVQKAQQPK